MSFNIKSIGASLDAKVSKFFSSLNVIKTKTVVNSKPKKVGCIKKTFRSDKRKALETYVSASTQTEQDASLENIRDYGL